jgi:hypothetical protein
MVFEGLYIEKSNEKGRGVFTKQTISPNTIIEISPVIVMSAEERTLLDQTLLHDYIFEWEKIANNAAWRLDMCLYNHHINRTVNTKWIFENEI